MAQLIGPRHILRPHSNPTDRASEVEAVVASRRASEVEAAAAVEAVVAARRASEVEVEAVVAAGEVVTEQ